jgi:hypothetical protein
MQHDAVAHGPRSTEDINSEIFRPNGCANWETGAKEADPNAILENGNKEINRRDFNPVYEC